MKKIDLQSLLRKHIAGVTPYSSARDEFTGDARVFLDANENPNDTLYNRYPDPHQIELKNKLAGYKNINPFQIFLGNGSDEIIDLLIRAFCEPGKDNVIIPEPIYGMYAVSAGVNNVEVKKTKLTPTFDLDSSAIINEIDTHTKIIFLCSPNNPTGNLLSKHLVHELLDNFSGLVVVDEAYIDFADDPGFIASLSSYSNLFILQTLSKAWGLAGLRLGIGISDSSIISILNRIKPPYNISSVSQQIAIEYLDKVGQKDQWVKNILEQRQRVENQLSQLTMVVKIHPSRSNFLLVRMTDAKTIYGFLADKGIVVRDRSDVRLCDDCLRITIGTHEENEMLIDALQSYK